MDTDTVPLELYDEMFDRLDAPAPEAWRPEVGDKIGGKLVELETASSDFGTYPLLTIATREGEERSVHAFHTVLKNEIEKKAPRVGDFVAIKYEGRGTDGADETPYERYRLIVRRAPSNGQQGS